MRFIRILCSAALVAPSLAVAQAPLIPAWPVTAGSRVRIYSPVLGDRYQTGSVVSATSDTLVFLPAKEATSTSIGTPNIVKMDVSHGTHTHKWKGALLGFVLGTGVGAALGAATYKPPRCSNGEWCIDMFGRQGDAAIAGVLGGLLGTVGGLMIGSRQTDTWVPVAVPNR
jgi:hypothetical protein